MDSNEQQVKEYLPHATGALSTGAILAITIPAACTAISIAWAIASYLMMREKQRAQVELARLEIETKKH